MADDLDPLVAEILLKGDDEFLSKLKKVGEDGKENFEKLAKAVENGLGPAETLTKALGGIETALALATAATVAFIEQQTELSQKTMLLADAFGVTSGQLQDIEATFAGAGVKVEQFERFANRLTITIAREWPQIAESIKNYATENDAATLRVSNAILRIRDAQNAVADNAAARASEIAKNYESMRGAALSVTEAENHLREVLGVPVSEEQKLPLKIAEARLAIDKARTAQADLARKAAKDERDDAEQAIKDQNRVKDAIIARAEAEQKASKLALTNVASIRDALDGIVKGNKDAAKQIDLTEVSVKHLTDAIIAQAKETNKDPDKLGYETLSQLSVTLSKDTDHLISRQQRLAIVNRLAGTSMQALGASAAEILSVLEHDSEAITHLTQATAALDTKEARKNLEDFRGALAKLNLAVSIMSQQFAIAISPAFTAFLDGLRESLQSTDGIIHGFVEGLKLVGSVLSFVGGVIKAFATDHGVAFRVILVAIGVAVTAAVSPFLAWPLIIAAVITAIGLLASSWDKIKDALVDNAVTRFWERLLDVATKVKNLFSGKGWVGAAASALPHGSADNSRGQDDPMGVATKGLAEGGYVSGPGTGTSDSIFAKLSNGEFVNNAASVQKYGAAFFASLNNMTFPGFAAGGLVASPVRLGGGSVVPATSTLNLSIDGRSFNGLKGPKSTIDDLSSFAISRQASAAGSNPSWMK